MFAEKALLLGLVNICTICFVCCCLLNKASHSGRGGAVGDGEGGYASLCSARYARYATAIFFCRAKKRYICLWQKRYARFASVKERGRMPRYARYDGGGEPPPNIFYIFTFHSSLFTFFFLRWLPPEEGREKRSTIGVPSPCVF